MCYLRGEIKSGIEHMPGLKRSEGRMWIKLHGKFFGFEKDLYIGLVYISPEASCHQHLGKICVTN